MFYCPRCKAALAAEALYCEKCGYNQKTTPTPKQSSGLIRPIRVFPPTQPNATAIPTNSVPAPLDATPAHLLALTPMTPPSSSAQRSSSTPPLGQARRQQFIRTSLVPSQRQEPGTLGVLQAKEAQQQQNTPPEQPTAPSSPVQSAALASEQVVQYEMPQVKQAQPMPNSAIKVVKGRPLLALTLDDFEGYDEGYVVTSQAAERWRTSWRKLQHTEAGPATEVSRGQSSVPEPLMSMQHSFARIRAIVTPQQHSYAQQVKRRFWTTIVLMLCLIGSLIGYITWTYLPTAATTHYIDTYAYAHLPSLSMQGRPVASIKRGEMLHLHGDSFDARTPIIFLLDGLTAINGTNGRELAIETSDQGSFDVDISTGTLLPGEHTIQAQNNKNEQSAYLNIQINLANSATANADLGLSVVTKLTFSMQAGKGNPPEQFVKLTNKNTRLPLQWYATAEVGNNLSWLEVDPTTTGGNLAVGGTGTIGIITAPGDLKSSSTAYMGKIIFTINQTEQLTLPVELQIRDAAAELLVSPNPLIGIPGSNDSCQAQTFLLLVNISHTRISWSLNMDSVTKQHIQLRSNGKPLTKGELAAAGDAGDTQALTLTCVGVHNGDTYNFTIRGNNISWPESVSIQANS